MRAPLRFGMPLLAALVAAGPLLLAQQVPVRTELDRIVAIVNGDLILASDLDQEQRMMAFRPLREGTEELDRTRMLDRLIDRRLILQQEKLQPEDDVSDASVRQELTALRQEIPACKVYHCETEAGWQRFVADQGLTLAQLTALWRQRMQVLQFVDQHFRLGIHITEDETQAYYTQTLVPAYRRQGMTPPRLSAVTPQINELLLQQRVSALLDDWLKSLRAQGTVRVMPDAGGTP
ncbi:MAG: peptidylprolyl isomerase [Acidobacteriota bacterium]|nr:peptidylprolyl isomerase [Acidobacteriota bacterium]